MSVDVVQLAIQDRKMADSIERMLRQSGDWAVTHREHPDPAEADCVIVADMNNLPYLGHPIAHPERIVLITRNDPRLLAEAWEAGLRAVVYEGESVSTVVLAIMAACLRLHTKIGDVIRPLNPDVQ